MHHNRRLTIHYDPMLYWNWDTVEDEKKTTQYTNGVETEKEETIFHIWVEVTPKPKAFIHSCFTPFQKCDRARVSTIYDILASGIFFSQSFSRFLIREFALVLIRKIIYYCNFVITSNKNVEHDFFVVQLLLVPFFAGEICVRSACILGFHLN